MKNKLTATQTDALALAKSFFKENLLDYFFCKKSLWILRADTLSVGKFFIEKMHVNKITSVGYPCGMIVCSNLSEFSARETFRFCKKAASTLRPFSC